MSQKYPSYRGTKPGFCQVRFTDGYQSFLGGLLRLIKEIKKKKLDFPKVAGGHMVTVTVTIHESEKLKRNAFNNIMCSHCPDKAKTTPVKGDTSE